MPVDDSVGLDDDQGFLPPRSELRQKDPEGSVCGCDPGLGSLLGVGGELLTKSELDESLLVPASAEGGKTAK